MKIKLDFITNSSSTSFIVFFPKKIETIDDVRKYMSLKKAQTVFEDAKDQNPIEINFIENNKIKIIDKIESILLGYSFIPGNTISEIISKLRPIIPDQISELSEKEYVIYKINKFFKNNYIFEDISIENIENFTELIKSKKGFIYTFTYSDENGSWGCEMEHGGTFNELIHHKISNH